MAQSPESYSSETGYSWEMDWTYIKPYSTSIIQRPLTSYNFVADGGMDIRIAVIKKLGMLISADYLWSHAAFVGKSESMTYSTNGTNSGYSEGAKPVAFSKNISQLCLNAGICYSIK